MFFDLGVQARHHTLQTAQSFQKLRIRRLSTLARGATRSGENTFYFGAYAIRTWLFLVALDLYIESTRSGCTMLHAHTGTHLSSAAGYARPGIWRGSTTRRVTTNASIGSLAGFGRVVGLWRVFRHGASVFLEYRQMSEESRLRILRL
jgi:hypothetical protein